MVSHLCCYVIWVSHLCCCHLGDPAVLSFGSATCYVIWVSHLCYVFWISHLCYVIWISHLCCHVIKLLRTEQLPIFQHTWLCLLEQNRT